MICCAKIQMEILPSKTNVAFLCFVYSYFFSFPSYKLRLCLHDTGATFMVTHFHPGARWKLAPCLHKAVFTGVLRVLRCRKIDDKTSMNMKRRVIPRLHDTVHAPEWIFVLGWKSRSGTRTGVNSPGMIFCGGKRIQSHKREPGWTRAGMQVAPVSYQTRFHRCRVFARDRWSTSSIKLREEKKIC